MKNIALIGALLFLFSAAYATTWYVHPDSALNSIQAGLDSCSTDDTVLVGPGVYNENLVWPNTQGIDLVSQYGIDMTFIDGGGTGRVILIGTGVDSTTIINGFTIQNGYADYGAGIFCINASSPTITNDSITNNSATIRGGGIRCFGNSSPIIANNTICLNHADEWSGGIACNASSPFITGNTITENTAVVSGGIGAAYESSPTITDNIITDNSATNTGGGIGLGYDYVVSATITGNLIRNNTASNAGGILCNESSPIIQSCCIDSNIGGGVYCYNGAEPLINYNDIVGNTGYGVYNDEPTVTVDAENNWWGDSTGPYHPTANPGGLGDSVSDYVDFDPWLDHPVFQLPAVVDIDPNTLNLKSHGKWITCYTELSDGYSVEDIDINSVAIIAIDGDAIEPLYRSGPANIGDYDEDGIPDLMVKFDRQTLIAILQTMIEPPAYVELKVGGMLVDNLPYSGIDTIRVIFPGHIEADKQYARLLDPHPNPFENKVEIRYEIPETVDSRQYAEGSIRIYDAAGRLVKNFSGLTSGIGHQSSVTWDGTDGANRKLPDGVYFIELRTKEYAETRKLLLIR